MQMKPIHVLLIEDRLEDAYLERQLLEKNRFEKFNVTQVDSLSKGLTRLAQGGIDVAVLDLFLPDSQGVKSVETLRHDFREIPIVVLTGGDGQIQMGLEAIRQGAQEYLIKGEITGPSLKRAIHHAIERKRLMMEQPVIILHDPVTGLYNQIGFITLAQHLLKVVNRIWMEAMLVYMRINAIKETEEAFGSKEMDLTLINMAEILKRACRESDILARVGEDRFAILALDTRGARADTFLDRIRKSVIEHNLHQKRKLIVCISAAKYDPHAPCSIDNLIARAEANERTD